MKKNILQIIYQILPVMLGVYLGFLVSNWQDSLKGEKQRKILLNNLLEEMEHNSKVLKKNVTYHAMLRDSSRHYSKKNLDKLPRFFKGIQIKNLVESAYLTGNQTGIINELKISQIQVLNQLYTSQKEYNKFIMIVLEGLMNMDFDNDARRILQYTAIAMEDIVSKEKQLIQEYKKLKTVLK